MFTPPQIFGIVNITEDSFSDGGQFLAADKAIARAQKLLQDGAAAIDLGPASSNPDASDVSPEEEIRRLAPVVNRLQAIGATISIDSYRSETQRYALSKKVAYLNDIQGFADPEIYPELAEADCKLIIMHSIHRIGKAQKIESDPKTIMDTIYRFFEERIAALETAGVQRERMILDPGMGFFLGSNPEVSFEVLRNITALRERLALPVFISLSRKSFLRKITGRGIEEIQAATLSAEIYAALQGVDFIRTHDARALSDGLKVLKAIY